MKILKTKWYLYTLTGPGTGIIRGKPLNTKKDGKRILEVNKNAYVCWRVGKGSMLSRITQTRGLRWRWLNGSGEISAM